MLRELNYAETITELHKRWTPHPAQVKIGKALFLNNYKMIMAKCGRNFGKTELICYMLWRYARQFPGSENYYFAPYQKQAKELIWATNRLQTFGPRAWLEEGSRGINNTELRLRFTNGSYIKMDGSDNVDSYRGVKPQGLSVYDEYKDFKPEFHQAYEPNLDAHDSPLVVIGTPPEVEDHHFYHMEDDFKDDETRAFFEYTCWENPHLNKNKLEARKKRFYKRGDGDVWEREYEVKKVFGGRNSIFPMLDTDNPGKHIRHHSEVARIIEKNYKKLQFVSFTDPGTVTCHASLYACLNPYTRQVYLLDEIYETDQTETSTSKVGQRIIEKHKELALRKEWDAGYDEAAAWFNQEMVDQFDLGMIPTSKATRSKEKCLTIIKDMLLHGYLIISDRCEKLAWEMRNYAKDDKNKIPKENDHLIDCLRYILDFWAYDMNHIKEQGRAELENKENKPWYKPSDDFPELNDDLGIVDDYIY